MQGAILVYDVTSRGSFNNIVGWMQSVTEHGSPNIRIAIVGHKCDLGDERSVETHEGQKVNWWGCGFSSRQHCIPPVVV